MKCRICGNSEGLVAYEVKEMMFGLNEVFTYFQCPDCGCLQIADIHQDRSRYYPSSYYSFNMAVNQSLSLKSKIRRLRDRYAITERGITGMILNRIFPDPFIGLYSGMPLTSRILDVGCGTGKLLWKLKEAGFENVAGIDPFNKERIQYDNGVQIDNKSLSEMDGEWDLITWHHSFEHIATPLEELSKAASLLSENGRCIIRIPVADSWAWENYKTNWVQIDAPRHFFLHSKKSFGILAEKVGLKIDKVEYDSTAFQFWGSEQYRKDMTMNDERSYYVNPDRSGFSKKSILYYEWKAKYLNLMGRGDQAIFFLQRNPI